jgi:hypothetical protein
VAVTTPTTHFEWAEFIRACAVAAIDPTHEINRSFVTVGEITADACECGVLAVSFIREFPSMGFPLDEIDMQAECGTPWLVVNLNVSLMRCWPVADGNTSNPATATALSAAASDMTADVTAIRRAIECCLSTEYDAHHLAAFVIQATEFVGPQGGCALADTTVLLGFVNGCGC